jgi:hypothetical protein
MEPGSCHVAVLSVTRWDDYKDELQPKFTRTEDDALKRATPDTMVLDQAVLDVFRASFSAKLAPSKNLPAAKPADAPGVGDMPTKQIGDTNMPAIPGLDKIDKDPMLEYLGATALYQEVKMLNRYVKDASIRNGYKAYVVRLQIAQMPGRRKAEYDLNMNIGFFLHDFNPASSAGKSLTTQPALNMDANIPVVVPLLVTDQVEGAIQSRRAERLTEIVLALSAAYAGIGGTVDIEAISQKIERALGRSYNSLLTVGRLGDNVLRVRLGARQTANWPDAYEAIPRTHNISLLVLLPAADGKEETRNRTVFVGTRREFRRPTTGMPWWPDTLGLTKYYSVFCAQWHIGKVWKRLTTKSVWCPNSNEQLMRAIRCAQNGRYGEFIGLFGKDVTTDKDKMGDLNRLWLDLVSSHIYDRYDGTRFTVPPYPDPSPNIDKDTDATLLDDGEATVATINMVKDIDPDTVSATWTFEEHGVQPVERITLAATRAELRAKSQLLLTFPSAKKFKRTVAQPGYGKSDNASSTQPTSDTSQQLIRVTYVTDREKGTTDTVFLKWHYALANRPDPIKALTVERSIEKLPGRTECAVELAFNFDKEAITKQGDAKEGFWMRISGATLDPTSTDPLASDPAGVLKGDTAKHFRWNITKPGTVTLNFKPLAPGTSVKVRFGAPDGMTVDPNSGFDFPVYEPTPPPRPAPASQPGGK